MELVRARARAWLQLGLVRGVGYPNPSPNQGGRTLILALTREADLDDGGGPTPTPPLTNAPRAPKTHWRQAAQLLPRGVQLCEGGGVRIRAHTAGGRKLSFELESAPDEGRHPADAAPSRATTRTRPHASHHAPQTEAPLPAESAAAAAAAAAAGTTAAVEAATLIGETVRPPSPPAVACARGGTRCVSRSLVRARFSRRRDRMPPPPLTPATPDEQWLVAMRALDGALLGRVRVGVRLGLGLRLVILALAQSSPNHACARRCALTYHYSNQ